MTCLTYSGRDGGSVPHAARIGPADRRRRRHGSPRLERRAAPGRQHAFELAETRSARIVWAETFDQKLDDAFLVLDEIGNRIVASIAAEIETLERNRAILRPPNSLDAWEAHHRGLWHMYRFSKRDNDQARHFFEMALRLDPTFSRAYAGLSFTHWQDVFQGWAKGTPARAWPPPSSSPGSCRWRSADEHSRPTSFIVGPRP